MKLILAVVMSLDGRLTRGDETNLRAWTSIEDATHLRGVIQACDAMILGRKTYETVRPKASADIFRLILSHTPEHYAADSVPGRLDFVNLDPEEAVKLLASQGYTRALLLGGPLLISPLLHTDLIDELYVTIEPYVFGQGLPLLRSSKVWPIHLRLIHMKQLNEQGTILLHYAVAPRHATR